LKSHCDYRFDLFKYSFLHFLIHLTAVTPPAAFAVRPQMSGNQRQAGQPPRENQEKKQVTRRTPPKSAPTSPSSRSATRNSKRRQSSKNEQTHSKKENDCESLSHAEEILGLDHLVEGETLNTGPHLDANLPLWAHRYGDENPRVPGHEAHLNSGGPCLAFSPLSDGHNGEVNGLGAGDNSNEVILSGPDSHGPVAPNHHHQMNDYHGSSTHSILQGDVQGRPWAGVASEHLPPPVFDYQLGMWLYSTRNTEITFSERLERTSWEPHCFARL